MSVDYSNITMSGGTTELNVAYYLRDILDNIVGASGFVSVSNSGSISIPMSGLPTASNTYKLTTTYSWDGADDDGGTFNYSLNFEVTNVPIPAAVWLFGSGLLSLVGMARRKKAA